jgi:hypothetical protein
MSSYPDLNIKKEYLWINEKNFHRVFGQNLFNTWDLKIDTACIIDGPQSPQAKDSVEKFNLKIKNIPTFNLLESTDNLIRLDPVSDDVNLLQCPKKYADQDWVKHVKLYAHTLTYEQVARIFNHMAAWNYCIVHGKPVIVLEHNAKLIHPHNVHLPESSIIGLATMGKAHKHNQGWSCMPGVFAYSIDSYSAKSLFNRVLEQGIRDPLELMFRDDQYTIILEQKAIRCQLVDNK